MVTTFYRRIVGVVLLMGILGMFWAFLSIGVFGSHVEQAIQKPGGLTIAQAIQKPGHLALVIQKPGN